MPLGGFGNLIALPRQHEPRERGNSVFVDDACAPYADQWACLDSIDLVSLTQLTRIASEGGSGRSWVGSAAFCHRRG